MRALLNNYKSESATNRRHSMSRVHHRALEGKQNRAVNQYIGLRIRRECPADTISRTTHLQEAHGHVERGPTPALETVSVTHRNGGGRCHFEKVQGADTRGK